MLLSSRAVLSQDQLAAIGSVAVESTYLERFIETLTWKLAKVSREDGQFLTGRLMMDSRLDVLANLADMKIKSAKRKKEFTELISDLKIANTNRNLVIHGIWLLHFPPGTTTLALLTSLPAGEPKASRTRPNKPSQTLSASKISGVADRIADLNAKLHAFVGKQWPRLPSLHKSKRQPKNLAQNLAPTSKPKGPLAQP